MKHAVQAIGRAHDEAKPRTVAWLVTHIFEEGRPKDVIDIDRAISLKEPRDDTPVDVWRYTLAGVDQYDVLPAGVRPSDDYDNHHLPRFLFLGAALLTFGMLLLLYRPLQRVRRDELGATDAAGALRPQGYASRRKTNNRRKR